MKSQLGVGLVEVLVALLILAVGLLGFISLQYQAVEATNESTSRIQAINIARDLAERIRVNREGLATYISELTTAANQATYSRDCSAMGCTVPQMADFDIAQVSQKARGLGMSINLIDCQGNNDGRQCIYIAWNDTAPTNGTTAGDCTSGTNYNPASTCLIMEVY